MKDDPCEPNGDIYNMPPFKITCDAKFDFTNQTLEFATANASRVLYLELVNFKEAKIRDALIQLGWTPPPKIPDYVAQKPD
jgi:hypothetical protein